ncbi:MAG: HD-GYP domain-containing protein [Deltaproteobacteria bacterium]|nr:HD-GYP domain-containing protein [Deltaproteobacteria bacterium]MBW2068473.1 HD-GYP domain-containing protein [Deltaproteobacteria bacterium]
MWLPFIKKKSAPENKRSIHPSELKIGMVIELPVSWLRHPFWKSRFRIRDASQIEKIMALNLPFLYQIMEDTNDAGKLAEGQELTEYTQEIEEADTKTQEPTETVSTKSYRKAYKTKIPATIHHRKIQATQKKYDQTVTEVKRLIKGVLAFSEDAVGETEAIMKSMIEVLLQNPTSSLFLINAKKKSEVLFHHAINVCILSLLIGKEFGLSAEELLFLGMGSIFHDIGKIRIPKAILLKDKPLSKTEKEFLKLHPQYGAEIAQRIKTFPEASINIIYSHHEMLDGSGYPKGLKEDQIPTIVRIVTIANLYDNYCNPRNPEKALTPHKALVHMSKKLASKIDVKILAQFIKLLGIYPPGTIVQLNNGAVGIVVGKSPASPTEPLVMLYDPDEPPSRAPIISLWDEPDLKIEKSLRPADLPDDILTYLNPPLRITYMIEPIDRM